MERLPGIIQVAPSTILSVLIRKVEALAVVAQWIELWPVNQKVTGSIPSQGTSQGCRPGP